MTVTLPGTSDSDEDALERAMAHLITEDDTPVDNRFSERQQRLLPSILFASWPEGKPFEALSNVGLFTSINEQAVVPDFMLSLAVEPRPVTSKKADRSYMTWIYGKAPELVVEVVSNTHGGELTRRKAAYARAGVTYYVVFDPFLKLGRRNRKRELRTFVLTDGQYVEATSAHWLPGIDLGLTVWEGAVNDVHGRWLRFIHADGHLLPTSQERAERERKQAELAWEQACQAEARADEAEARISQERDRAEREIARLKAELEALRREDERS
jgi:Uma2 family endonuclease